MPSEDANTSDEGSQVPCSRHALNNSERVVSSAETERLIEAAQLESRLGNGWTLFSHQKEAVRAILQQRRLQ